MKAYGPSKLFSYLLLAFVMIMGIGVYFIPPTQAGAVTLQQSPASNTCSPTISTCSKAFGSNVIQGDYIGVLVETSDNSCSVPTINPPSDTLGDTFLAATSCVTSGNTGSDQEVQTFYAVTKSAGADTVTVTTSLNVGHIYIKIAEVSGVTAVCSQIGTGTSMNAAHTPGSCSYVNGFSMMARFDPGTGDGCGTGFTFDANYGCIQTANGGVPSPTNYPITYTGNVQFAISGLTFTDATPTGGGNTGTFVVGSCPNKNTATFALTNNTEFFWTGTVLPGEQIINISSFLASSNPSGSATETLQYGVYWTLFPGAISPTNALQLQFPTNSFTLTAGTKNKLLPWAANIPITAPAGATWGFAIFGNSKITINQSSLAGMSTGASAGPTILAPSFTSLAGTSTQLYFCANVAFQTVSTTTVTITSTTGVTTGGGTATTTVTSTVTTFNLQTSTANLPNILLALIIILGPSLLIAGITRSLWGGILGVSLGIVIAIIVGIIAPWIIAVLVLMLVAVLIFAARSSGGGGGGGI